MNKKYNNFKNTLIENRLWNLKIEEMQRILSNLEALFSYLGMHEICLKDVRHPDETVKLKDIIKIIFEESVERSKSI